jgi:putrescine transport system permease protein
MGEYRNGQTAGRVAVLVVPWAWLALFLIAPMAIVVRIAFSEAADAVPPYAPRLNLASVAQVLGDPLYARALWLSVKVAGLSTLACLIAGYPMALAIARAAERRRVLLLLLTMLPFWTGFLMRINAWIGLLQDDGWINAALLASGVIRTPLRLLYTDAAMYVGMTYTYLPFMVLPLYARMSKLDPVLEEAAADLGASPWRAFLSVTLPFSLPGVWAGLALVFVPALGEYVIPELLGGPRAQLIGRLLWEEFFDNRDWPTAAALAMLLLAFMLAAAGAVAGLRRLVARQ